MKANLESKPARRSNNNFATYDKKGAQLTLHPRYITTHHEQARWAEFTRLRTMIGALYIARKRPLKVFDIGIGYARIPFWLSKVGTWKKIGKYIGIDISKHCVTQSRRLVARRGISDKVKITKFDAVHLNKSYGEFLDNKYDLVVCTYFTAGDFRPSEIKIQNGQLAVYDINVLSPNKDFVEVFKGAYNLLDDGGKIVIGSVYYDSDSVRVIQEKFYIDCKMTVITSSKDPFTATAERFWSERFDKQKIYNYLSWIPRDKIEIIPLDDYNFALMVVIHK